MYEKTETDEYGVHEMIDVTLLDDNEMKNELASRVLRMIEGEMNLKAFMRNVNVDGRTPEEWMEEREKLTMEDDENFCLVRECLRCIRKDNDLLTC